MEKDSQYRKIRGRLQSIQTMPIVGLFIDLDGLVDGLDDQLLDAPDSDIASLLDTFVLSVGRQSIAKLYCSHRLEKEDGLDDREWGRYGIKCSRTTKDAITKDKLNLQLAFDAYDGAIERRFDVAIIVSGTTDYTALAERLAVRGVAVVIVGDIPANRRVLPRNNCVYLSFNALFGDGEGKIPSSVDPEDFDYDELISLLDQSEKIMPFVGARYFVNKVMWRIGLTSKEDRQAIFQHAAEAGIIEIYTRENINGTDNPVSACRLNRDNEKVIDVLSSLELDDGTDVEIYQDQMIQETQQSAVAESTI